MGSVRARALLAFLAAVLTTLGTGVRTPAANAAPAQQPQNDPVTPAIAQGSAYTPVTPVRVLDTRNGTGGTLGPVGPTTTITLDLSARLPATATAVVLNVTGTEATAPTYVTVFPHGTERPIVSNLNLVAGRTRPNLVTVATGTELRVDLYNHNGSVHLLADLAGYYSTASGSRFTPLVAHRVYDRPVGPGGTATVDLVHAVPASATAVTFNLTATEPTAITYVTAWPTGAPRPTASNVNVVAGETAPNLVTVAIGADRKVALFNHSGSVRLIADLAGFYTPDYGALFTATTPTRILDTRDGIGTPFGLPYPIAGGGSLPVIPGEPVPDSAIGAVINFTGIEPTETTYVTAWQYEYGFTPTTSNLNLTAGQIAANLAIVETSAWTNSSRFDVYNHRGETHVAGDLAGYFWVPRTSCATGCVRTWGHNFFGMVGTGVTGHWVSVPAPLIGLSDVVAVDERYAVRSDGTVWAWGLNYAGQLGNGWYGSGTTVPVPVLGLTGAVAVAGSAIDGGGNGYALRSDGTVWAWGYNVDGQLGNGGSTPVPTPVQVPSLAGVTAIAAGADTGYALRGDGTVWSWGANADGQLGNGSTAALSRVPVQVAGLTGVVAIASGARTAYALRSDGTVWSWGRNDTGQLGNGTAGGQSRVPVQVSGLTGVTRIAGNQQNGYALRNDGTVWSWGDNFAGNLGNGEECFRWPAGPGCRATAPVQVSGLFDVTAIGASRYGGYALRPDGTVWSWGRNWNGDVGHPDTDAVSLVPVQVTRLTGVNALGAHGGRALVPGPQ